MDGHIGYLLAAPLAATTDADDETTTRLIER